MTLTSFASSGFFLTFFKPFQLFLRLLYRVVGYICTMSSLQIKILVLFLFFALGKAQAGSIDDGFKALEQFNYFEAKKQFEKSIFGLVCPLV